MVMEMGLPLESQIQVHKEYTESISNLVGSACVLGCHSSKAGCGDNDTSKASHIHSTSRVHSIMKPSTERIIDDTYEGVSLGS